LYYNYNYYYYYYYYYYLHAVHLLYKYNLRAFVCLMF